MDTKGIKNIKMDTKGFKKKIYELIPYPKINLIGPSKLHDEFLFSEIYELQKIPLMMKDAKFDKIGRVRYFFPELILNKESLPQKY